MARVIIGDEQPLYRDALASAIRACAWLELAAPPCDTAAAIDLIEARRPDVALLDAHAGTVQEGLLRGAPTRIVLLATELDSESIYAALHAGAAGYLSKREDRLAICAALVRAARGEVVLSPAVQTALGHRIRAARHPTGGLTEREREILGLAADGLSTPEMADRLFLSRATVKTHLAHLYEKLEVSDKTAAVATGFRRGIIH